MNQQEISKTLHTILIQKFDIPEATFHWDKKLQELHPKFKLIGYIELLENLLNETLPIPVSFHGNINGFLHSPKDIIDYLSK